ncbi:putative DNA topology modulation protein FlaR [Clostridium sp. CAG:492]|nr:putative DNA topology modulation protein FlaR [Clostridium sp. CAG:492]
MYNHIPILGGSGSGKSILCNILYSILNIPAIHLDSFNYLPNWTKVDTEKRDSII